MLLFWILRPIPGICPWTPVGDFHPQTPSFRPPQRLGRGCTPAVWKPLNRSRCRLERQTRMGPRRPCIRWSNSDECRGGCNHKGDDVALWQITSDISYDLGVYFWPCFEAIYIYILASVMSWNTSSPVVRQMRAMRSPCQTSLPITSQSPHQTSFPRRTLHRSCISITATARSPNTRARYYTQALCEQH